MAKKKQKKADKAQPLVYQIDVRNINRTRQSIDRWRRALAQAENRENPRRSTLLDLFEDVILNAHLSSVMGKRILAVTNSEIKFQDKEGSEVEEINGILDEPWFIELLEFIIEVRFYGHSLIEPEYENGEIVGVNLVNRRHVVQEKGIVMLKVGDADGINYRDPLLHQWLIEVGKKRDLGLLAKASPYCLYLKDNLADWSEHNEKFGMPHRSYKYDHHDPKARELLIKSADAWTAAGYDVIPKDAEIDINFSASASTGETYEKFDKRVEAKLSKLVLGQTMTTEDGSSKSQSEVHKDVEEAIEFSDKLLVVKVLNKQLRPILELLGFPLKEGRFFYPEIDNLSKEQQLKLDLSLAEVIEIPKSHFYKNYGVTPPEPGEEIARKTSPSPGIEAFTDKGLWAGLSALFNQNSEPGVWDKIRDRLQKKKAVKLQEINYPEQCCGAPQIVAVGEDREAIEEQLLAYVAEGEGDFNEEYFDWLIDQYTQATAQGLRPDFDLNAPDHLSSALLESNLHRFSAAKSVAMVAELGRIHQDTDTFSQFKAKAEPLLKTYNEHHLRTEYNQAHATSQASRAWLDHQKVKDLYPNSIYKTVGDDKVRDSHRQLEGLVFSLDDPNIDALIPPNGWGDRCWNEPADEDAETVPVSTAIDILKESGDWDRMKKYGFDRNRGKLGEVFASNQLYIKNFKDRDLDANSFGLPKSEDLRDGLPNLQRQKRDRKHVRDWFASKVGKNELKNNDLVRLLDHKAAPVHLSRQVMESQVTRAGLRAGKADLIDHLEQILTDPDEIWLQVNGNGYLRTLLKFFGDNTVVIRIRFEPEKMIQIQSWELNARPDGLRKGVLTHG